MTEQLLGWQAEGIPRPRFTKPIGDVVMAHETSPAGNSGTPEITPPPVGQALAAFYEHCQKNTHYTSVSKNVQARMRPGLALSFVREIVTRTGEKRGDPSMRPTFDESEVRHNIDHIQNNYGATPYPDEARNRPRSNRLNTQMQRAAPFTSYSAGRVPISHEINAAYVLHTEALQAEDAATQDSLEVLLAAYGMSLKGTTDPIE